MSEHETVPPVGGKKVPVKLIGIGAGVVVVAAIVASLFGDSLEADIKKGFVEKYEKPSCLQVAKGFPFNGDSNTAEALGVLVEAGLLTRQDAPASAFDFGTFNRRYVYDITDKGKKAINEENKFCYGQVKVAEIVDYTDPVEKDGTKVVTAEARLNYVIDEDWAKAPALSGNIRSEDRNVKELFIKKKKAGWVMQDTMGMMNIFN